MATPIAPAFLPKVPLMRAGGCRASGADAMRARRSSMMIALSMPWSTSASMITAGRSSSAVGSGWRAQARRRNLEPFAIGGSALLDPLRKLRSRAGSSIPISQMAVEPGDGGPCQQNVMRPIRARGRWQGAWRHRDHSDVACVASRAAQILPVHDDAAANGRPDMNIEEIGRCPASAVNSSATAAAVPSFSKKTGWPVASPSSSPKFTLRQAPNLSRGRPSSVSQASRLKGCARPMPVSRRSLRRPAGR